MSAVGFLQSAVSSVASGLIRPKRAIGSLTPDVVTEETHNDRLTITEHPVERTANITDHAYKEPPTVVINCGWTNSSLAQALNNLLSGNITGALNSLENLPGAISNTAANAVYQQLLAYQDPPTLIDVYTGKRKYTNMLVAEIEVTTNKDSEYALMVRLTCQHVNLTNTTTVSVPPNDVQKDPASTGSTTNLGAQNITPVTDMPSNASFIDGIG